MGNTGNLTALFLQARLDSSRLPGKTLLTLGGKAVLEVSGGITLDNALEYAAAGPDIISVGALTQSAPALPMSLDLVQKSPNVMKSSH